MAASEKKDTPVQDTVTDPRLSTQSQFSTIKENTDLPETNPPAGRHVIEELGKPKKGVIPAAGGS